MRDNALAKLIRPWTLCDDGGRFDHGSERAAKAVLEAGYRNINGGHKHYEVWSEKAGIRVRESLWDTDDLTVAQSAVTHLNQSNLAVGGKFFFVMVATTTREPYEV